MDRVLPLHHIIWLGASYHHCHCSIFYIFLFSISFAIFIFAIIFQKTNVAATQGQTDFCQAEICYALAFLLKEDSEEQDHDHKLLRGPDKYLQHLNLA